METIKTITDLINNNDLKIIFTILGLIIGYLSAEIYFLKLKINDIEIERDNWRNSCWSYIDRVDEQDDLIEEIRKNRDKIYNKHNVQINYYKKRLFAIELVIAENFKNSPAVIILIKEDLKELLKKPFSELKKIKKNLKKTNK